MIGKVVVKNTARTRQSARKAGIIIENPNPELITRPKEEQEQPDIM